MQNFYQHSIWVSGVIWHQLCDATLWMWPFYLATSFIREGFRGHSTVLTGAVPPGHPLEPPLVHYQVPVHCYTCRSRQVVIFYSRSTTRHSFRHSTVLGHVLEHCPVIPLVSACLLGTEEILAIGIWTMCDGQLNYKCVIQNFSREWVSDPYNYDLALTPI